MSDPVTDLAPRYRLLRPGSLPVRSEAAALGFTHREERRLETIGRMIDRLEHRAADPTFRKSGYMMAELSALKWALRILRGDVLQPLGTVVESVRTQEQRT